MYSFKYSQELGMEKDDKEALIAKFRTRLETVTPPPKVGTAGTEGKLEQ